jgi:hypothetical protein
MGDTYLSAPDQHVRFGSKPAGRDRQESARSGHTPRENQDYPSGEQNEYSAYRRCGTPR